MTVQKNPTKRFNVKPEQGMSLNLLPGIFTQALVGLLNEYDEAVDMYGHYNSAHEGWAVIMEEVDELWQQVCKKRTLRDPENMKTEALQIAASALRFAIDCEQFCTDPDKSVKTGIDQIIRSSY